MRQKGLALVLVLWVLSLLTIMAGSFALSMRRETSIIEGVRNNAQAMAIAESGLAIAEMMLLNPDQDKRWRADGNIYQVDFINAKVRLRVLSETGKIDINKADQTLLQGMMSQAPVDAEQQTKIINAILDWRDQDDLVHINGAEKKEYQEAGLNYQPRNKPFQSVEELQLILGIDASVFEEIEDLITIYSGQQQVDLRYAAKEVLQVIPELDAELVDTYITERLESAKNGLPAPVFPASSGQGNTSAGQNNAFTVISEAMLNDNSSAALSAVIKQSDETLASPFQVLEWRQITGNNASLFTDGMSALLVKQYAEFEFNN
ncbi:MAG: type II secretion system protein GspK [Methylococcaceae bacterium]